ncbi:MAG: GNAT family N-acetyltransferase [Acidimicrobiia bacterium]
MSLRVTEFEDPASAYEQAHEFLVADPTQHNVLLTVLDQSRERRLGGRFWIVGDDDAVVGFASQSPPGMRIGLSRMGDAAIRALAAAIAPPIPGVVGDAAAAATFAGHFAERHGVPVSPFEAQRLYELCRLEATATAPGALRLAVAADGPTLVRWTRGFATDTETAAGDAHDFVDVGLAAGRLWVWDDNGPVSMAGASKPAAGVCRMQRVYTPTTRRGAGYATACVEQLSRELTGRGLRCVLYTQMRNPTSNAIYRRIGYRPVSEVLSYDFG